MASNLSSGMWKLTQHVGNNPGKVLSLCLLAHILGAAALSTTQTLPSSNSRPEIIEGSSINVFNSSVGTDLPEAYQVPPKAETLYIAAVNKTARSRRQTGAGPQRPEVKEQTTNSLIESVLHPLFSSLVQFVNFNELKRQLHDIECNVTDLISEKNMSNDDSETRTKLLSKKADIQSSLASLTTRVDNIQKDVSQEFSKDINAIYTQIQKLKVATMDIEVIRSDIKEMAIADCITAIREARFDTAKVKWNRIQSYKNMDADISKVVRGAFDNSMSNFDRVNYFAGKVLPDIPTTAVAYKTLVDELKRIGRFFSPEMVQVGYWVEQHMKMPNYVNIAQIYKSLYDSLKSGLPTDVQNLFRGPVCIKNIAFIEYLHPSDDHRGVTWSVMNWECFTKDRWIVEAYAKDYIAIVFGIKNVETNEYLCVEENTSSTQEAIIALESRDYRNCYWTFEPNNERSYKIKNTWNNGYLLVRTNGNELSIATQRGGKERARPALTLNSTGLGIDAHWSFDDCSDRQEKKLRADGYN